MSLRYTRSSLTSMRLRLALLLASLTALGCLMPSIAAAKTGEVTEQPVLGSVAWLSPPYPSGGSAWFTRFEPGKIFALSEGFESTAFEISGTKHSDGDLTQGSDGNVYFTITDNTVGQIEPNVIGRLVPSSGTSTFLTLPSTPTNCAEFVSPIPECGIDLTTGPENTVWYTQFKQKSGEHVAKVGKIGVSEVGTPITQYSLTNSETQPSGIIEAGGSHMWFLQKFGVGFWPAVTYNLAKAKVNGEGKLEVSEYAIPSKAPGELVRGPGESVYLFQNLSENHRIVKVTAEGKTTEVATGEGAKPQGPAVGPAGEIWFVEEEAKKIGRLVPETGEITRYSIPNGAGCNPFGVIRGFKETMLVRERCASETTRLSQVATK